MIIIFITDFFIKKKISRPKKVSSCIPNRYIYCLSARNSSGRPKDRTVEIHHVKSILKYLIRIHHDDSQPVLPGTRDSSHTSASTYF